MLTNSRAFFINWDVFIIYQKVLNQIVKLHDKEIEQALISNSIDIAVHSFKDITSNPHPQLQFSGFLLEESETDAFILFEASINRSEVPVGTNTFSFTRVFKPINLFFIVYSEFYIILLFFKVFK